MDEDCGGYGNRFSRGKEFLMNGWSFEKKITASMLLQVVFYAALIVGGYVVLAQTVANNEVLIQANERRIEANTIRINAILEKMETAYVPRRELNLILSTQTDLRDEIKEIRSDIKKLLLKIH